MFATTLSQAERLLNRCFPSTWNPLYNLGALSFYLFWVVAISGLYLFAFFDTSVASAYDSVEKISHEHFYIGSVIRGLHRYASTLMGITVTLHLFRELIMKRYQGARWFSWVTGVPLLWLLFASAIGGYWLVWDERAQYIALATARLFDAIPIVVEPMAFGFMDNAAVNDRFFTLLIFLHVGVPLSLLLGMIVHVKRIKDANIQPPRGLAIGVLVSLAVLALVYPALSLPAANFDAPLQNVEIDWVYMNIYPLVTMWGAGPVWLGLGIITFGLLALPLLPARQKASIAVVDPEFCNGCSWCYADCPYEAIYMKPHESREGHQQAVVLADYCVGCGICAGACPSATPFKSFNEAKSGIDLPEMTNAVMLQDVKNKLEDLPADKKILLVGCRHGTDLSSFESDITATRTLECIGQLPPSYMDFLCRQHNVDAVLLTGCSEGNCYHRSGIDIQEERLVRLREPHLRYADVRDKITRIWAGKGGEAEIAASLAQIKLEQELEQEQVQEQLNEQLKEQGQ